MKQSCSYYDSSDQARQCTAYWKKCVECDKVNYLREVCRSERNGTVHDLEQEPDQPHEEEEKIGKENINSIIFNSKWLVITTNLKNIVKQSFLLPYDIHTGSDGNIIPLHVYRRLFTRATQKHLATIRNKDVQLKTYNWTIITQLGICKVKIDHSNQQKMSKFFVVPGNGQALLGITDTDMLIIIHINCNTIHAQEADRANKCSTNTAICQGSRHKQHYTDMMQKADRAKKSYANTDSISKFDNCCVMQNRYKGDYLV